mgnify:CR=1 FL=1
MCVLFLNYCFSLFTMEILLPCIFMRMRWREFKFQIFESCRFISNMLVLVFAGYDAVYLKLI